MMEVKLKKQKSNGRRLDSETDLSFFIMNSDNLDDAGDRTGKQ